MRSTKLYIALAAVIVVALMLILVIGIVLRGGRSETSVAGPSVGMGTVGTTPRGTDVSVPVPPDWAPIDASSAKATAAAMGGAAKPVIDVADIAERLAASDVTKASCEATVSELDAHLGPDQFRVSAGAVPDPVLSELLLSTATALSDTLVACTTGADDVAVKATTLREVVRLTHLRRVEITEAAH